MSLGAISNRIHYGYNASAKARGNAKLLRITDIQNGSVNWTSVPYCSLEDREIAKFRLAPGDIVIARTGGTIGKSFLIAEKLEELAVFASYLIRVIPDKLNVNPSYLLRFLDSPYYWEQLSDNSRGTGQPNVNAKALAGIKVPLPPIEEQLRIVAKISQLFDQIELAEKAYNELSEPLAERFRQLCLEKAIQGKLVPQLESEPEVEQIGKAPEDVPFTIPEKWKWVCLSNLGKLSTGTTPKTSETGLYGGNFPFIKPGEISEKGDLLPPNQFLTEAGKEQARVVSAGAVLMVCIGTIGKTAIANVALSFNQQINAIDPKGYLIDPIYLHSVFRSSWFQSHVKALASATTIKIVNKNKWGSSYIPLPPLDEQHRIIEKLNELLGTVGQLENTVSVP